MNIENFAIKSRYAEVLLEVTVGSNLRFSKHVKYLYLTAHRKLYALPSVYKYISLSKRHILVSIAYLNSIVKWGCEATLHRSQAKFEI